MKWPLFISLLLIVIQQNFAQDTIPKIEETFLKIDTAIDNNDRDEARELLKQLKSEQLSDYQKYELQLRLKRLSKHQIGVNYELNSFQEKYPLQKTWNTVSLEYQYALKRHIALGRVTYSDRFFDDGILYELEAYPILSKKMYAFVSLAASQGGFYQKFGSAVSVYNNIGGGFETEVGFRYFDYETNSFFTFSGGLTKYVGSFYLNARVSLGPKNDSEVFQNYQFTTRYYFENAANYVYLKIGTGVSPDDNTRFLQVVSNPSLNAYYGSVGFSKWYNQVGVGATAGVLVEELFQNKNGMQLVGAINLRYRFY